LNFFLNLINSIRFIRDFIIVTGAEGQIGSFLNAKLQLHRVDFAENFSFLLNSESI